MNIEDAIACLKANGYRISKPQFKPSITKRWPKDCWEPKLNAIGKPYGEGFDPKYRMKYHTPAIKRAQNVEPYLSKSQWEAQCANAKAIWEHSLKYDVPLPTSHANYKYCRQYLETRA